MRCLRLVFKAISIFLVDAVIKIAHLTTIVSINVTNEKQQCGRMLL